MPDNETLNTEGLTEDMRKKLAIVSHNIAQGESFEASWSSFISTIAKENMPQDVNAFVQFVLRNAYLETNKDLQFYSEKVMFFNETKRKIRAEISGKRKILQAIKSGMFSIEKSIAELELQINHFREVWREELNTTSEIEEAIKKFEDELSSVGDEAQLANIDLQNALQKQQQTLQTMSNVSKMLHDTAMAIIRKIG